MSDNELKLHSLQPDVFSATPMWEDFLTDLADTIENQVRGPIRQLETIRDVGPDSDPVILAQTINQLGVDFPADILAPNLRRLRHSTHFLARMRDDIGTEKAYPLISFLLGRYLEHSVLFTKDYRNFYDRAYESLNIDGGKWYGTTHIDLGLEALPTDRNLLLPEGVTRKDRVLDAYLELAPVSQVIRRFYWISNIKADVSLSGRIYVDRRKFVTVGRGNWGLKSLTVDGPDYVDAGSTHQFLADFNFGDKDSVSSEPVTERWQVPNLPLFGVNGIGINSAAEITALSTEFPDTNDRLLKVVINDPSSYGYLCYPVASGKAIFTDQATGIDGGWDGAGWPDDGDIGDSTGPLIITRTLGTTTSQWYLYRMDFAAQGTYSFQVRFETPGVLTYSTYEKVTGGDVESLPDVTIANYVDSWTTDRPDLVHVDSKGNVSFGNPGKETDVQITVTAQGKTSTKTVRIRGQRHIDSIYIDAPDSVSGGDVVEVRVYARSGNVVSVLPVYAYCIDPAITMEGPRMTVNGARQETEVELYAEYHGFKAVKKVTVRYVPKETYLTDLVINAPDFMYERQSMELQCVASFSDGSTKNVFPYWETSTATVYVGEGNTLYAGLTYSTIEISVTAVYQFRGLVKRATHVFSLRPNNIAMTGLLIRGPIQVTELTRNSYSAIAKWSDGSTSMVRAEWSTDTFSIDSETGMLETGSIEDPIVINIVARSGDFEASMTVNGYAEPVSVKALRILGPDNIGESIVGQYTALATFSDGKEQYVEPNWNLKGAAPGSTINADGQFVFNGDVPSGIIEIEAVHNIGGRTYRQTKPVVLVPKVSTIVGLVLAGPHEVGYNERITLVATAVYSDGRTETVIPQWVAQSADPVNVPDVGATIFDSGIVQGRSVDVATEVVIVARYFKAVATHRILVNPYVERSPDVPVSSRLIGPPVFRAGDIASFAQAIVFEDCSQELLVSSDWTVDVDPSIATIDANGYLYSINGQAMPVTVTATYGCGGYTVTNSTLVNILPSQEDIFAILINGPDAVLENTSTSYSVELFRVGQQPVAGTGTRVTDNVTWEVISGPARPDIVVVDGIGTISVVSVNQDTSLVLQATYKEGFSEVKTTKIIAVNKSVPIYGVGPIGVRNDAGIKSTLTSEMATLNSNQSLTMNVRSGQYGYLAYPVSLGLARFVETDNGSAGGTAGGWDGATWPDDGSIGTRFGPLTVAREQNGMIVNWYLYRTDLPSLGNKTWIVIFGE